MEGKKIQQKEWTLCDILIEVLEVALNSILYIRNIYPDGIFQRHKKYNISVMLNQHPDLNAYIKDVLESIRSHIQNGTIEKVAIQICKEDIPLERFVFEMKLATNVETQCYLDMEAHLRAVLLKLNTCEATLQPLPEGCTFQVLAYTKRSTLNDMEEKATFQDFPWVVVENNSNKGTMSKDLSIIPIRSCNTDALVLQCYVEENSASKKVVS